MGLSNREFVGRALKVLASSLGPYISSVLADLAPGILWPKLLEHKDAAAGRTAQSYSATDLNVQLRVMTESLGSLGYPFNLAHAARSYTSELRQTRNLWAHNAEFDDNDTYRPWTLPAGWPSASSWKMPRWPSPFCRTATRRGAQGTTRMRLTGVRNRLKRTNASTS